MVSEAPTLNGEAKAGVAATVIERVAARLVDIIVSGLIVALGCAALYRPLTSLTETATIQLSSTDWMSFGVYLLGLAVGVQWLWWWAAKEGQSPGRRVMGLTLVGRDGQPLGYGRVLFRWIVKVIVEGIAGIGTLLNAIVLARSGKARSAAIHDRVVAASVVRSTSVQAITLQQETAVAVVRTDRMRERLWPGYQAGMVLGSDNPWDLPPVLPASGRQPTAPAAETHATQVTVPANETSETTTNNGIIYEGDEAHGTDVARPQPSVQTSAVPMQTEAVPLEPKATPGLRRVSAVEEGRRGLGRYVHDQTTPAEGDEFKPARPAFGKESPVPAADAAMPRSVVAAQANADTPGGGIAVLPAGETFDDLAGAPGTAAHGQLYSQGTHADNQKYSSGLSSRVINTVTAHAYSAGTPEGENMKAATWQSTGGPTSEESGEKDMSSGMNMSRGESLVYDPNDRDLIWLLLGSDGQSLIVDAKCMIGRKPDVADPDTQGVLALPIRDDTLSVSKTHAMLGLDADGLWVMDWGSRNGTFVAPAGQQWEQLEARQAYRLLDGDYIKFGSVEFGVELQRESLLAQQFPDGV